MKAMKSLVLAAALSAVGLASIEAQAAGGRAGGGHWSGGHGSGGGHWSGGHRSWGGGPRVGLYLGAPLLFGSWYWGYPYDYYYPRTVIVDRVIERDPAYPEGTIESAPTTELPAPAAGAPTQGPTYMNFCESAKAYYPKVRTCPEGWKFVPSR